MRHRREGLADLAEALRWVEQHWAEQPAPPIRLHQAGIEPGSILGAPMTATVFWRYLTLQGDAVESVSATEVCYHPRLPQDRNGMLQGVLCACSGEGCDRLHCPDCYGMGTRTVTTDRFTYPMRAAMDALAREPRWYRTIITLARTGWDVARAGVTPEHALTAIRKVHSRYSRTYVRQTSWVDKSESQRQAEAAA